MNLTWLGSGELLEVQFVADIVGRRTGMCFAVFEGEAGDVSVSGFLSRHVGHCLEWRRRSPSFYTTSDAVRLCGVDGQPLEEEEGFVSLDALVPPDASVK